MRTRYLMAVIVAIGVAAVALAAVSSSPAKPPHAPGAASLTRGTPPAPPSELQRLQIENDIKQMQLDQQQVQILTAQFEQTKAALQVKLKALERDGWELDLNAWQYVPKGAAPPPAK